MHTSDIIVALWTLGYWGVIWTHSIYVVPAVFCTIFFGITYLTVPYNQTTLVENHEKHGHVHAHLSYITALYLGTLVGTVFLMVFNTRQFIAPLIFYSRNAGQSSQNISQPPQGVSQPRQNKQQEDQSPQRADQSLRRLSFAANVRNSHPTIVNFLVLAWFVMLIAAVCMVHFYTRAFGFLSGPGTNRLGAIVSTTALVCLALVALFYIGHVRSTVRQKWTGAFGVMTLAMAVLYFIHATNIAIIKQVTGVKMALWIALYYAPVYSQLYSAWNPYRHEGPVTFFANLAIHISAVGIAGFVSEIYRAQDRENPGAILLAILIFTVVAIFVIHTSQFCGRSKSKAESDT